MKGIRVLLIILAAFVAFVAIGLVVAFSPSFQRWVVLRAVAGRPGETFELQRLAVGTGRFEIIGARWNSEGIDVQVDRAVGDYRLWPLLTGERLEVAKLSARGVKIDATAASDSAQSAGVAAPAAAPGALGRLELPFELVVGAAEIEGEARLPGKEGAAPVEVRFRATGGGLAPGQQGQFQVAATARNPDPAAPVGALRSESIVRLTQTKERTFSEVAIEGTVEAEGRGLAGPTQLKLAANFGADAGAERYLLTLDALGEGKTDNLIDVRAELPAGAKHYAGQWSLNVSRPQVVAFYLGGELPDFEATGTGQFRFTPSNSDLATQGELNVAIRGLERIDPGLRAIGPVQLRSRFDLANAGGVVRLNTLQVTLAGAQPVLEFQALQAVEWEPSSGQVRLAGTSGDVARLRLLGLPIAWVRPFINAADVSGGELSGEMLVQADGGRLLVRSAAPLRVDTLNIVQEGEPLLMKATVGVALAAELSAAGWKAQLADLQLVTPEGDQVRAQLNVSGEKSTDGTGLHLDGRYQARLPALLRAQVEGLQAQAEGEFDVAIAGTELRVAKLTSRIRTLEGQPVLSTEVRQPFTFSTETKAITPGGAEAELMRVDLGQIALAPLLGDLVEGLSGSVTQGSFSLETADGGWKLRPVTPVVLTGVELRQDGQPALGGMGVELAPLVNMSADGAMKAELGDVSLRTNRGEALGTIRGALEQDAGGLRWNGGFQLELPAMSRMPAFAEAKPLSQGRAVGEFKAVSDGAGELVEARITLNGLAAQGGNATLPVANLSLRASRDAQGAVKIEMPILLDRAGMRSDLKFAATLTRGGPGHQLSARLTGNHAALDDLMAVVAVFSAAAQEGAPKREAVIAAPVKADELPAWSRVSGQVGLEFKTLTYGPEWSATDLRGTLQIEPARVSLPIMEAAFGEKGRLEAHGEMTFEKGRRPYRLGGGFSVTEFDAGPLFRAIDPSRPPTVEGRFNVEGEFAGEGRTVDETLELTRGNFELTSRQGIFRGLKRGTEKVSVATRAVELGAALGSLFGSDKMRGAAEKVAGGAYFADQLAQEFGELKYDQLNVRLERGESLDMKLTEVALISPEVRLVGQGTVTYIEGRPLLNQPLNVELQLSGRGKVETLLDRSNLLIGELARDDLGYAKAKYPIVIGGTIAQPDALSFYTRLATSKLLDSLTPEN